MIFRNPNASHDFLSSDAGEVEERDFWRILLFNPDWSLGLRYERVKGKKYAFSGTSQHLLFEIRNRATDTEEKMAKPLICDADGVI